MVAVQNQFDRALALLASQFRDTKANGQLTNLQKLIKCLIVPAQELQLVNLQLLMKRGLALGEGVQLDLIGLILGLEREPGQSDDDYREALQFQIFINTSNGTPEDSIRVLSFLTRATEIGYHELRPAAYQMETNGTKFPNPPNDLNDGLFSVSPAGVNYVPIVATYGVPISFELSGDLAFDLLYVASNIDDALELKNLEVEPYSRIIYVSAGNVAETGPNGGLDELNFPIETAGKLSELIQKNGNLPARTTNG